MLPLVVDRTGLREATAHVLRLEDLWLRVLAACDEAGIRLVSYKGPTLAYLAYGDPALRVYSDIDVLVDPRDLPRLDETFTRLGLRTFERSWARALADDYGELPYTDGSPVALDVHWHVIREARQRRRFTIETGDLLERSVLATIGGREVRVLSPEDHLITVAVHACFDGAYRLGGLVDVRMLEDSDGLDHGQLQAICAEQGTALAVQAMLTRARRVLGYEGRIPPLATGTYLRFLDALTVARPPERSFRRVARGGLAFRATRSTSIRSWAALGPLARQELLEPLLHDPAHRWRSSRAQREPDYPR